MPDIKDHLKSDLSETTESKKELFVDNEKLQKGNSKYFYGFLVFVILLICLVFIKSASKL